MRSMLYEAAQICARRNGPDIDTAVVDSLKALDPKRPIREADIAPCPRSAKPGHQPRAAMKVGRAVAPSTVAQTARALAGWAPGALNAR
jgi:hypothetical protein